MRIGVTRPYLNFVKVVKHEPAMWERGNFDLFLEIHHIPRGRREVGYLPVGMFMAPYPGQSYYKVACFIGDITSPSFVLARRKRRDAAVTLMLKTVVEMVVSHMDEVYAAVVQGLGMSYGDEMITGASVPVHFRIGR